MRVVVLAVGAPKNRELAGAIREYEARISHYFSYDAREVSRQRIPTSGDTRSIPETESRSLLGKVPAGFEVIAIDQRGERWSSEQLSDHLDELALHGRPGVAFLIGGPLGLSEAAREEADRVLSLSSFTLPHELARLVLVEQIYRAGTIRRGEPYHKNG